MTEDQFTDAAIERIREVAEDYRRLARSIEDAVRPDGSGRSIDRLRRILETSEGTLADTMRPIQNDAVAGVASCYLRLIARIAQRTCEAADEGAADNPPPAPPCGWGAGPGAVMAHFHRARIWVGGPIRNTRFSEKTDMGGFPLINRTQNCFGNTF